MAVSRCRAITAASIDVVTGAPRMMDIVYTALTAGLIALTWGLVRLCDRVT